MKKIIGQFIANIRQKFLVWRIHREIKHRIFPQLAEEKSCGYPFGSSPEELEKLAVFGNADAQLHLALIEKWSGRMPETCRDAFRYIMYRDLNARLKLYEGFAQKFSARKPSSATPEPQPST